VSVAKGWYIQRKKDDADPELVSDDFAAGDIFEERLDQELQL
jgi:hypothetical protein